MNKISQDRKRWYGSNTVPVVVFLLVGVAIYSNTLHSPFVFDDGPSITRNPMIKHLGNFYLNSAGYEKYPTRFIGYLSFALNYAVGAFDPFGYHIVNLTVHILNSILVYYLVLLTFRTPFLKESSPEANVRSVSLISGLLFLVHPVQTEAVTFIVQRLTSLTTTFFLLSLLFYVESRIQFFGRSNNSGNKFLLYLACSLFFCLIAMKTKEISFTLPFVILIYDCFFFDGPRMRRAAFLLPFLLSLLVVPLSLIDVRAPVAKVLSDIGTLTRVQTDISRSDYFLTQLHVIVTYIRLLILPIHQNLDYDYPIYRSLFDFRSLFCAGLLLFLFGVALWLYLRSRRPETASLRLISLGILWFFVTLSVESSLVPIEDVIFEHRIYLPSVGAFLSFAVVASLISGKWSSKAWTSVFVLIMVAFSGATYKRNMIWRDDLSLWSDNVKKSPRKGRPHYNLGNSYLLRGMTINSIQQFQKAIQLDSGYADAYLNLGVAYASVGEEEKAMTALQKAVELKPADSESHYNLGLLYANKGFGSLAIEEYNKAVSLNPGSVNTRNNLGITLAESGRIDEAIEQFRKGLQLNPGDEELLKNLENALRLKSLSK